MTFFIKKLTRFFQDIPVIQRYYDSRINILFFLKSLINVTKNKWHKCIYNKDTNKKKETGKSSKWEVPFLFIKVVFMITTY